MTPLLPDRLPPELPAAKADGIGWLTINNPRRRNALSLAMWQAIPVAMQAFADDPEVRVVVLRGAGEEAFASGADISEFEKVRATEAQVLVYDEATDTAAAAISACPKPTVAMIHGFCMGGAVALAISCDLRIAADTGRFGVPAAKLGVGYDYAGIRKLMQLVGPSATKDIFFTARQFDAAEALQMGWVNRVLPSAELEAHVRDFAATLAANAPLTLHAVKTVVGEALKDAPERDLGLAEQVVRDCFNSEDYVEGRRAFMEKRPPAFKGR